MSDAAETIETPAIEDAPAVKQAAPTRRPRRTVDPERGVVESGAAPAAGKRRRRAPVGGLELKLHAPTREGYVRRWFNDNGNRIADAKEMAYEHVTDAGIKTDSPDKRVSRLVGTKANGEPLHAYLMETPVEEYAHGVSDREAINRRTDEAIDAGRDSTGQTSQIPNSEMYGRGSIQRDR